MPESNNCFPTNVTLRANRPTVIELPERIPTMLTKTENKPNENSNAEVSNNGTVAEQYEMFIGNIHPDVDREIVVETLQRLFASMGVISTDDKFSLFRQGPRREKQMFVALANDHDRQKLITRLDGYEDMEITFPERVLKLCNKKDKPRRRRSRRKKKSASLTEEQKILEGINLEKDDSQVLAEIDENKRKDTVLEGNELDTGEKHVLKGADSNKKEKNILESSNQNKVITPRLQVSKSAPNMRINRQDALSDNALDDKYLLMGQLLRTEDRTTEYKRGGGRYLKKSLIQHVRKYACAFLNSEGGKLFIGVADNGQVYGVPCNRRQEDATRLQIDGVISKFQPPVFPALYSIKFIPVIPYTGYVPTDENDHCFKVLEICINSPIKKVGCLYETDKGDVFVRRDGSVQGPLKASQIIDWCKHDKVLANENDDNDNEVNVVKGIVAEDKVAQDNMARDRVTQDMMAQDRVAKVVMPQDGVAKDTERKSNSRDEIVVKGVQSGTDYFQEVTERSVAVVNCRAQLKFDQRGKFERQYSKYLVDHDRIRETEIALDSLYKLNELEASLREHRREIERDISEIKEHYEAREKALKEELERSKYELRKEKRKQRPGSATCVLL
eukprot:Seg1133.1 transcript_id=Seg1133.1/GoldUCD/mRNA.D3Y31 product="Schlafen-like protein 1" protein_id=Seg1133.1/GoldUCD/D3Y31